ncbi:hypothetical protein DH2020_022046 [Rehmannia glutinosa]|uniref:Transcription factor Iwr1 domain-containing protein n=1 Tax=Rehmannia glutinosa TaxID=99300 RepID=A0ABR0WEJ5_REHGL
MAESSSTPPSKPVIVRVKRKYFQSAVDAFWLEIRERPLKRPLLDFGKLSISDASSSRVEELKTKKILVRHVETVTSSESTFDVLRSFVPNSSGELKYKDKNEEGKRSFKTVNVLSRNARFEQIWRSRKEKKEAPEDEAIYEMCRLYDVVRVDVEEHEVEVQEKKDTDLDDRRMMAQYLPLLREVLPSAAVEIEVQVDDEDDFYDGPDDSEYETDDSNAENNPLNEYPDEEISEDEDEGTSRSSAEKSEGESTTSGSESEEVESGSQVSYEYDDSELPYDWSENGDHDFGDELYSE